MKEFTGKKLERMKKLSTEDGVIAALAIDQRGSMRKMVQGFDDKTRDEKITEFKSCVSKILTKYSSSILLDPIYGLEAIKTKDENAGLLMSYEITGYRDKERNPELLRGQSVKRLADLGADAIKILLYYDVDDTEENNENKKAFVERVGSECAYYEMPFFLEIITYDQKIEDSKSKEFAKIKPRKVNEAVREFTKDVYNVDCLKLEVPVNMNYVEGYGDDFVYTAEEAKKYFKEQSDLSTVPFIFLSAGVSSEMFIKTLEFAKESGSKFNGVLCGRATWRNAVDPFIQDENKGIEWLEEEGVKKISELNDTLKETATPWM